LYICIGDIILATGKSSLGSFAQIVSILKIGFASAVKLSQSTDGGLQEYGDRLKESLVQTYTCVLHAYNDSAKTFGGLLETLPMVSEFLMHVCKSELRPTVVSGEESFLI
jgi:hypothetical protein